MNNCSAAESDMVYNQERDDHVVPAVRHLSSEGESAALVLSERGALELELGGQPRKPSTPYTKLALGCAVALALLVVVLATFSLNVDRAGAGGELPVERSPPHASPLETWSHDSFPVEIRVPLRRVSKSSGVIPKSETEVGFACTMRSADELGVSGRGQIVGWDVMLDNPDSIHHMDLFLCTDGATLKHREVGQSCSGYPFSSSSCGSMAAVYDKGASGFRFPPDVGLAIGKGTPFSRLILQIHYLLPRSGASSPARPTPIMDSSGMRLHLVHNESALRPMNARMIGFMDTEMRIPGGVPSHEHRYVVPVGMLSRVIKHDGAMFGELSVFAAHLHAHDSCTRFEVNATAPEAAEPHNVARISPYYGYGPNQTFMHLSPNTKARKLRLGDTLTISCQFDTTMIHGITDYGVGHGDEMCGPLLFYYPTDPTVRGELSVVLHPFSST